MMFAIHGRAASSSLSLLILTGLLSLNFAKPITISSDGYFLHRIKLDKILLCPTDMVETARNATNWPVDSVTIPDDSRCMTYNDTFKYPVGTIMAGDHRDCLGELINGATLTMRKLGVDPFMTGMSLASWYFHFGELPPWVNFAEAGMDRSQCESAFAEMHTKNSSMKSFVEALQSVLPPGFDIFPINNGTVEKVGDVRGCDLSGINIHYNSGVAKCWGNISMFSHSTQHPGRCDCRPLKDPSIGPLSCLDLHPERCMRREDIFPLMRTYLSVYYNALVPQRLQMVTVVERSLASTATSLERVPGNRFIGWSAVWDAPKNYQTWWIKFAISVLFGLTVVTMAYFQIRGRKKMPAYDVEDKEDDEEMKYIE